MNETERLQKETGGTKYRKTETEMMKRGKENTVDSIRDLSSC
jgi:hypothetical protein